MQDIVDLEYIFSRDLYVTTKEFLFRELLKRLFLSLSSEITLSIVNELST